MRYRPMSGAWAKACDAKSVPGERQDYPKWAAWAISRAIAASNRANRLDSIEWAGAYIRAWRQSLPVQGERLNDYPTGTSDDDLLWAALREAVRARLWSPNEPDVVAEGLRAAEAALRTWWKRQEQP